MERVLKANELETLDAYFRAANYLACGELYLKDNPLLKEPLKLEHIKKKLVGHWGTTPGQNFIYVHLNRIIKKNDLNMIYISGPGHGGGAALSNVYLEKTYSKIYPNITYDEAGLKKLFKSFSFPGGTSSHVASSVPGSIHEGGELGYSLSHAVGAALDNPNLWVACVIGDGEAETGPLATSWQLNKFLNPKTDGVVLPILHLNGYKIANPTILARMTEEERISYFRGLGWDPYIVKFTTEAGIHEAMARTLDTIVKKIQDIKEEAIKNEKTARPLWPMIILETPKGWTGPKFVGTSQIEGSFHAHQIPIPIDKDHEDNIELLENWLKSYRPWELFDGNGTLKNGLQELIPSYPMGMNPHANGGILLKELKLPSMEPYMVEVKPGTKKTSDMLNLSAYIRDIIKENPNNFRIFGPDEASSNRLNHVFEVTNRKWNGNTIDTDEHLNKDGAVIDSILSEHACEGMLEGYLLTGRHGIIHTYEAFSRVIDSMVSQHAKWLKTCEELPWRKEIASLNILLTSHVWQQDHNGYTHQEPGFINHILTKKLEMVNVYLPIDSNTLLATFHKIMKTKNKINTIIASKHPSYDWLTKEEAIAHVEKGIGKLKFISNDEEGVDIVLASAGDTPTVEIIATAKLLKKWVPNIKVRVVNVNNLLKLYHPSRVKTGITEVEFDALFTIDKPVIFAFHGYPNVIYDAIRYRKNGNFTVMGYQEEGAITTPFDMRVLNQIDRFHLTLLALEKLEIREEEKEPVKAYCNSMLAKHTSYIREYGVDMDEIEELIREDEKHV